MSDHALHFQSRRSPVFGTRGMVATSQPLAVQAGLEILAAGGNAADAAIATAAVLNVTEPTSTGLGGDCFALFYDAKTQQVSALNGSGRAPASLTLDLLVKQGFEQEIPPFHPHTITIPGACAGWVDLIDRHGSKPLELILAPAIKLAEEGFPVSPLTAYFWARGVERQLREAPGGLALTINGRAPKPGELFQNPGLARTLRAIADGGKVAFYEGDIAKAIATVVQSTGGVLSEDDLASHHSTWDSPISTVFQGMRIWECPPNGQGLTALIALNILDGFELTDLDPLGPERLHLVIEALRLAFADARWYIADPLQVEIPLESLLSSAYAAQRRNLIDPQKANPLLLRGGAPSRSDTVYLSVVDGQGNACSFINSNYMGFGTGFVPDGWGFTLQNRGHNFSLDPDHPNALAPNKRPYHTIIPTMATREDGSLYACFGVMGGFMQPQGHVQVLLGLLEDQLDPQATLDRPRLCLRNGTADSPVALEEGIPEMTKTRLAELGHDIQMITGHNRAIFGRGQIILRDDQTHVLTAGSDPRADGMAAALP